MMTDEKTKLAIAIARAKAAQGARTPEMEANRQRAMAGDFYMGPERGFITEQEASVGQPTQATAAARSVLQGSMLGYGDEITAGLQSAMSNQSYKDAIAAERGRIKAGEEAFPKTTTTAEIGGAFLTPVPPVAKPATAIATGTAAGMLYASGKAEGGDRIDAAVSAAPESFLFSSGAVVAQKALGAIASKAKNFKLPATKARLARLQKIAPKLRARVQQFENNPTVFTAKAVRDAAYEAVDNSDFRFPKDQFDDAVSRIRSDMDSFKSGYVRGDTKAEAALSLLEKNAGRDMKLSEIDNVRKRLMKRWVKADDAEAETIMSMVGVIDDLIENSGGGDAMRAAREAHKTYMRLDFLEKAFEKAADRSSVTYAGGNQYNNYAKVFERILSNEKQSRMFTPEMLAFMRKAIDAPIGERTLRKLGKLSPDGNGMMLALSVIGGSVEPSTLAAFGAGALAKQKTDRAMMSRADQMLRLAAGIPLDAAAPFGGVSTNLATGAAVAGPMALE